MPSLDVRLKSLEAEAPPEAPASAQRIFDWCQARGFAVAPVGKLNTAQWLATVTTETLSTILNDHTPEAHHAKS
jgi:hypothetical protein